MEISKALVFDIKRFAVHDGFGLRTTVFLKGVHCVVNGVKIQKDYLQKEGYFISKIVVFIVNDVNSLQLKNK